MKILNKIIFVTLLVSCPLSKEALCAEQYTSTINDPTTSFLGSTRLEGQKGFYLDFEASGSYGPISGYMQTPLGGMPGSTSDKRPKFDELGIDRMMMVNLSLSGGMGSHQVYVAAHLVNLSGEATLDQALIFHGEEYPAGTEVKANTRLNWYEIGYQYNIHFGKERASLSIAPIAALALWDFSVELKANDEKNSRSYMKGTPRVGLEFEWLPVKPFSVSGKAIASLPFDNMPHIYTLGLTGKYSFVDKDRLKISLFAGVEYDQVDFKDNQTEPNHVKANMGPLGLVGMEIKF
jgi:hypothetical protein